MRKSFIQLSGLLLAVAILMGLPAHACQGPQFESRILLAAPPSDTQGVEFVGKVSVTTKSRWIFFKQPPKAGLIAKISESTTHPELVGTNIELFPILSTSCGPWLEAGDSGYITGNFFLQTAGPTKLSAQSHRGMDILFQSKEPEPLDLHGPN